MVEFLIGSHRVTCLRDDQRRRVWHCDCANYERRLLKYGEGFCEHLVIAIRRAVEAGHMANPGDVQARV